MSFVLRLLPFLSWFKGYDLATLRTDFISGVTVALVLVPQSMAYAQLAGLPAYYGLYAAFLPPIIASLFGSSRQLATGPVAVVSLMTSAALGPLATAGSEAYIAYALLLALVVGVFQLALGVLRLGLVVNFLSHPVVNGFSNAAAIIIATSQLSKIFGVYVDKAPHHYETIYRVVDAAIHFTHWPTLGMALLAFAVMIGLKRVNPRIPNVLVAVVVTTALGWAIGFEQDETIRLEQVRSATVPQLAASFNEAVETKLALEQQRAESRKTWAGLDMQARGVCRSCHDEREVAQFQTAALLPDREATPGSTRALHGRAGLLDECIAEVDHEIAGRRDALRRLHLVRAAGGGALFYPRDEVPPGAEVEAGTWRIKVGNRPLDFAAVSLQGGGAVVGAIPEGLPRFPLPQLQWSVLPSLFAAAVIISLLGFMEAISIAKAMAARTRQKLDPNQELIGQGLANILGSFGQSYAVSGSFSRSAVNLQAGARTGLSNVISGGIVVVVLLFFARWLYYLPQAVLAAIIMMAVVGLLNVSGFVHAWHTNRLDGIVALLTFVATLGFAPHLEYGIFLGVAISLGAYLYRSMRPKVVELAPHPDGAMRDARRHKLRKCQHVAVISFDGPLNFASTSYLEGEILDRAADQPGLRHVLIAGNGITEVDATGEEALRNIVENLRGTGLEVSFSGLSDQVIDVLKRSHLYGRIGADHFYSTRAQAVAEIYPAAHAGADEADCPYREAMPPIVELSLHPDGSLRNAARHDLPLCRHIAVLRFDAPLSYANTSFLEQEILARVADRPSLRHVLFVGHGITSIDAAGAGKLGELVTKLRAGGYAVCFSGLKEDVLDVLAAAGVTEVIGEEHLYPTQAVALAGIYARAHAGSSEESCPLADAAPRLTEVSLHPDGSLRDARRRHLRVCDHIGVLRFDGPFLLASSKAVQSEFVRWAKRRPSVHHLVFLAHRLHKLEANEIGNLLAFVEAVREADYRVVFAGFSDVVFEQMGKTGVADAIGLDNVFPSEALAIQAIFSEAHAGSSDDFSCPLRGVVPRVTELSLHPDGSLRDARRHGLATCSRIAAIRFDGPLNFAAIRVFEEELRECLRRRPGVRHIHVAGHTLAGLDVIAAEELTTLIASLRGEGYALSFSGLSDEVIETMRVTCKDVAALAAGVFPTQAKAIDAIHAQAHEGSGEEHCPLLEVVKKPKPAEEETPASASPPPVKVIH